jgi:hypothetical protein
MTERLAWMSPMMPMVCAAATWNPRAGETLTAPDTALPIHTRKVITYACLLFLSRWVERGQAVHALWAGR